MCLFNPFSAPIVRRSHVHLLCLYTYTKNAEKIAQNKQPANLEVQVTKVNPEIWVNMDK
jgi:hypothetical protein